MNEISQIINKYFLEFRRLRLKSENNQLKTSSIYVINFFHISLFSSITILFVIVRDSTCEHRWSSEKTCSIYR